MSWSPSSLPGHCCHLLLFPFVIVLGSLSKHPGSHCPLMILIIASQSSSPPSWSHHPLLILVVTSWSLSSPLPPFPISSSWSPSSPPGPHCHPLIPNISSWFPSCSPCPHCLLLVPTVLSHSPPLQAITNRSRTARAVVLPWVTQCPQPSCPWPGCIPQLPTASGIRVAGALGLLLTTGLKPIASILR